ncbi:MAG: diaminopimelate decarboxylase [Legionellales bacterium]|nr:diaminopimelate decarboxylase [Legionellales bacterium]|tara:strand:+ start:2701 stop:3951 length:1251 start_codon:yes stop_codon:yes gene_type:complete
MDHFNYRDGELFAEEVPVAKIAEQFGSPCYVYSRATLERHWHAFNDALGAHPHKICYAVKANSNLAVLNLFARLGSGFDIVSQGELERVVAAGGDPSQVIFSGVGKQEAEMARALELGIYCFNIESGPGLEALNQVATRLGKHAPIAIRLNPDVDPKTHPYISTGLKENKFGVTTEEAIELYRKAAKMPNIVIKGLDCHIGSQLTELQPFLEALDEIIQVVDRLAEDGITIEHLDLGGGLGVRYQDEAPPEPAEYAAALVERLQPRQLAILLEPGRAIAANAGILVTKVEYLKPTPFKNFAIVDAAMNDLLRPALYDAWQRIIPVKQNSEAKPERYDVVGPVCETGDFLGKERELAISPGDLLAVRSAGAYGFTMSSNYNSRPRVAEVMVDGAKMHLVRRRETLSELFAGEELLPL